MAAILEILFVVYVAGVIVTFARKSIRTIGYDAFLGIVLKSLQWPIEVFTGQLK